MSFEPLAALGGILSGTMKSWRFGVVALLAWPMLVAAAPGDTAILPWRGAARAAVSVTMDDGYASQWRYMAPLLASRGFTGTFFIVTSWVDTDGLWPDWRKVAAMGHEIGSHTHNHLELPLLTPETVDSELRLSRERLQTELGPTQGRTFGFPFSKSSPETVAAVKAAGYEAARTGGDLSNGTTPLDLFLVQSRHPLSATPLWQINTWIDEISAGGGWLVIGVHGIDDPEHPAPASHVGYEPVVLERYVAMVDHLAAAGEALWVASFGEVARQVRQRDASSVGLVSSTSTTIALRLEGPSAGPPLTLVSELPASWAEVRISAGPGDPGRILAATLDDTGRRSVRYVAVAPSELLIEAVSQREALADGALTGDEAMAGDAGPPVADGAAADGAAADGAAADGSPRRDARAPLQDAGRPGHDQAPPVAPCPDTGCSLGPRHASGWLFLFLFAIILRRRWR